MCESVLHGNVDSAVVNLLHSLVNDHNRAAVTETLVGDLTLVLVCGRDFR
jgi:hypothetical protein